MTVCALVPFKNAVHAKTRLRTVLSADECAFLAHHMAVATVHALTHAASVGRVVLLGETPDLATKTGCEFVREDSDLGLSANLFEAGQSLDLDPTDTLAVFPADVPLIGTADVEAVIGAHRHGLTLCPAARDGGTNALLLTPPGAMQFHFGIDSARLHAEAAREAGLAVQVIDSAALSHDIDTAQDLQWLCRNVQPGPLMQALRSSGILSRVLHSMAPLTATMTG